MSSRFFILISFVACGVACGGQTTDINDSGSDAGNPDTQTPNDSGPAPNCPAQPPGEGASCTKESLQCEYGNDPRSTCNLIVTCTSGSWQHNLVPDPNCPTPPQNPSACAASFDQVHPGSACATPGTFCNYSTSTATIFCSCTSPGGPILIDGGANDTWQCGPLGVDNGCPQLRPHIGDTCTDPNLNCGYDVCGTPTGLGFQCNEDTLTWTTGLGELCAGAN